MTSYCEGQMAAVVESACKAFDQAKGIVPDDFYSTAAETLARLCHPPVLTVGNVDWTPAAIKTVRDRAREVGEIQAAEIIDAMGAHIFAGEWTEET